MHAINTTSLTKAFGSGTAVDGVTMSVEEGEIFGFLGPNGAGKSTTMMMLTTLLKPTSGRALVAGHDVSESPSMVRRSIGYVQQDISADEYLTGRENLVLQARLYRMDGVAGRIDEVLSLVELEERQDDPVVEYSGGMRKRLDMACGLLHRPSVLFLDEPTVGLDTQARTKLWEYIRRMHAESGMTIFLSTHYMEEADRLCDRVGIIDSGRMQVVGAPRDLKAGLGGGAISIMTGARSPEFLAELSKLGKVEAEGGHIRIRAADGEPAMRSALEAASRLGITVESASLGRPTLDDVFLSYTGKKMRDAGFNQRRHRARMRRLRA